MYQRSAYDKFIVGTIAGFVVAFVSYGILLFIYDQLDKNEIISSDGLNPFFRERTIGILAIMSNVLAIHFFNKQKWENAIRGITIPFTVLVLLWIYKYYDTLFV